MKGCICMAKVYSENTQVYGEFIGFQVDDKQNIFGIDQFNTKILLCKAVNNGTGESGAFILKKIVAEIAKEKFKYIHIASDGTVSSKNE